MRAGQSSRSFPFMLNHEIESKFPALVGGVVTEAHARICRERGHAQHTVDGKPMDRCPRCGEVKGVQE